MSRHDVRVTLKQMRDHAQEAIELVAARNRSDLDNDRMLELSLTRLLEIVGEAANRVPREQRTTYSAIPWPDIIGIRNRMIHGYDHVDLDVVWRTIHDDLPPLVRELDQILA